jgi:hypothetical protein
MDCFVLLEREVLATAFLLELDVLVTELSLVLFILQVEPEIFVPDLAIFLVFLFLWL